MSSYYYRKCAKCGKTRAEDKLVTYHRFPDPGKNNITKALAWAKYCWPDKEWTHASLLKLNTSCKVLCGRHFASSQFYDDMRQNLSKFAVPDAAEVEVLLNERDNIFEQQQSGEQCMTRPPFADKTVKVLTSSEQVMGFQKCCIPDCSTTSKTTNLSEFPAPRQLFELWKKILFAKYPELKLRIDNYKCCFLRICNLHFERQYLKPNGFRLMNSVPTLFSPQEISSGKPEVPILIDWKARDHDRTNYREQTFASDSKHTDSSSNQQDKSSTETDENKKNLTSQVIYEEPIEEDPLAFKEYKDVTDNPQQFGNLALDDPLAFEEYADVTDNSQQFGKLSLDELVPIPPDKVAWPKPPNNETEVNKPEDPFLPDDYFLPDAMDPEIIKGGVQPNDVPTYGDNIHPELSVLWPPILRHGLTTEARNTILNDYLVPNNCRLFEAPKMNTKIVEMVPEKAMTNDSKWATMQQYIGTALTAINRAMEALLLGEPNSKVLTLRHLNNACLLMCDLHCSHTKIRVKNVTPYLDDTTQEVIKGLERDETVFGYNFNKKWKMAKKREKPVKKAYPLKKEKKKKVAPSGRSLVLYSGRWHPPLRKTGKVRGKKAGAGVRRQNVSATGSSLQTPRKRKVRQSKVRAPDHSGQHILTSTESGSAQNNSEKDVQRKLKRPTTPKTYSTKKRKQEEKIDALAPDKETNHIHIMPMEESDSSVQKQSMEEQLNQSRITRNSTIMVTTGAVPLVLPPQLPARDMPTLLTIVENEPPDPSTYIEIVDDQTPRRVVTEIDCQRGLSVFLRFKDT